jgi:hypothetical protein
VVDAAKRRALVNRRWVHVDGDDADRGPIYRDAHGDIPLSRRPKEFLEFTEDGTVRRLATGPDDRAHEVDRTTWNDEGEHVAFRFAAGDAKRATEYRIVEQSPDRLIVHRQ